MYKLILLPEFCSL